MTARGREAEYDAAAVRRRGQVVELAGAAGPKESEAAENSPVILYFSATDGSSTSVPENVAAVREKEKYCN